MRHLDHAVEALVLDNSEVGPRRIAPGGTHNVRNLGSLQENIVSIFIEIVCLQTDSAIEHLKVQTYIRLVGDFPRGVRSTHHGLGHTGLSYLARPEGITVGILIDRRKVEESIRSDIVVTGKTIRAADLQVVDEVDIPELLSGQHPTG